MRIAAIDQGTTSTRCLVYEDGTLNLVCAIRHAQRRPRPGWLEHDPLEILTNVERCIAAAGPVDAFALANQGESCMAWDSRSGEPLSPIIVWQDRRSTERTGFLKRSDLETTSWLRSGVPLDPYFSASKLWWLLEHDACVQDARRSGRLRLGTVDSFLMQRLCGVSATDATTASRTGLMNLATRSWDAVLCELHGIPLDALVPIRRTVGHFGEIGGTPLVVSIVDQQAALFGNGCRNPGDAKVTFGTGAFALALVDEPDMTGICNHGLSCSVAWESDTQTNYAVEGGVYDAGAALEWARRAGIIDEFAGVRLDVGEPAIARGLAFVPALSGLAAPHWDPNAGGLWLGLSGATTRADLQRSILEGIALQTAEVVARLDACVTSVSTLSVDGGVSVNDSFLEFFASVLGRDVERNVVREATAYGCARLAGAGSLDTTGGNQPQRVFRPQRDAPTRAQWLARYREARERSLAWTRSG